VIFSLQGHLNSDYGFWFATTIIIQIVISGLQGTVKIQIEIFGLQGQLQFT